MSRKNARQLKKTGINIPSTLQAVRITALPEELVRRILQLLSCQDVCNAALACKAFYAIGNALSLLKGSQRLPRELVVASLRLFVARRSSLLKVHGCRHSHLCAKTLGGGIYVIIIGLGVQVEGLHLTLHRYAQRGNRALRKDTIRDLMSSIQQ